MRDVIQVAIGRWGVEGAVVCTDERPAVLEAVLPADRVLHYILPWVALPRSHSVLHFASTPATCGSPGGL